MRHKFCWLVPMAVVTGMLMGAGCPLFMMPDDNGNDNVNVNDNGNTNTNNNGNTNTNTNTNTNGNTNGNTNDNTNDNGNTNDNTNDNGNGNANDNGGEFKFAKQSVESGLDRVLGIVIVDIDADGDLDVISAAAQSDRVTLYLNDGAGAFTTISVNASVPIVATSVAVADFDADGDLDIAATGLFQRAGGENTIGEIVWFENPGDPTGTWNRQNVSAANWGPRTMAAGDITGDGDPDLIVGNVERIDNNGVRQGNGVRYFRNAVPGSDTWMSGVEFDGAIDDVVQVLLHDVDGDNVLDVIAAARDGGELRWYENGRNDGEMNPAPSFAGHDIATGMRHTGIALGNFDMDADLELVVATASTTSGRLSIFDPPADPTTGGWIESPVDTNFGFGDLTRVATGDFDGDGLTDIAVVSDGAAEIRIYRQNGDGSFTAETLSTSFAGAAIAAGDLDGDGKLDAAAGTDGGGTDEVAFWRNESN